MHYFMSRACYVRHRLCCRIRSLTANVMIYRWATLVVANLYFLEKLNLGGHVRLVLCERLPVPASSSRGFLQQCSTDLPCNCIRVFLWANANHTPLQTHVVGFVLCTIRIQHLLQLR